RDLFANPVLDQLAGHLDGISAATAVPSDADGTALPSHVDGSAGSDLDDEIAALERLLARKRAERAEKHLVQPLSRDRALVCTYQQEGLWFEHQLDPSSSAYHIPFALRLRGALNVTALQRALHALVVRHEALRTRFVDEDGVPRQLIDPAPVALP